MKFSVLLVLLCLALTTHLLAQHKVIELYDGAAPGSESWTWSEQENQNNTWQTKVVYNVSKPTLTVFQPEEGKANGAAVVIAPGGAFHILAIDNEGNDVAQALVEKGITCFVLKYRLARITTDDPVKELQAKWGNEDFDKSLAAAIPMAVADGREAIAYIRKHAEEYNVIPNRIGIMGFSAGGTVTSGTLFDYTRENRPDFAAPVYPYFPKRMIGAVAKDAPPLFVLAASNDGLGLAPHSVELYNAWLSAKRDAEIHMYARGDHGFGMKAQNIPTDQWIDRFTEWLDMLGYLKPTDPLYKPYLRKEFESAGNILPYRILYPDNYDKTKKYPLILLLHGGGERGNDNEKQLVHGAKLFLEENKRKSFPAIILVPQCPEGSYWAAAKIDRSKQPFDISFNYAAEPQWPLVAANELVKRISNEEAVDKSRIYITGLSMGAMGTFESIYRYPDLYAAALPICGGGDTNAYDKRVKKTAFWIFHGAADAVVDVNLSREMANKLKSLKVKNKYTEYPGVNHNSWDNAFSDPAFLSWMFQHKRK